MAVRAGQASPGQILSSEITWVWSSADVAPPPLPPPRKNLGLGYSWAGLLLGFGEGCVLSGTIPIEIGGRSLWVTTAIVGCHGDRWREFELTGGLRFAVHGRPIMQPEEWKVLVTMRPVIRDLPRPTLKVV